MRYWCFIAIVFVLIFQSDSLFAQKEKEKEITYKSMVWYEFSEEMEFRKKWILELDGEERHYINPLSQSEFKVGIGGGYIINKHWRAMLGFSYAQEEDEGAGVPELRVEQEFYNKQKFKWLVISNRYKIEERFIQDAEAGNLSGDYFFALRFRYRLGLDFTLAEFGENKNALKLKVNDEIMINAGKEFVKNIFDQNRFYGGLSYTPVKGLSIGIGYMNAFKERKSGYKFYDKHIVRISIEHELSFPGKKAKQQLSQ